MALRLIHRRRRILPTLLAALLGIAVGVELEHRFGVRAPALSQVESAADWYDKQQPSLAASALAEPPDSPERLIGKVVGIADGDTLTLLVDKTQYRIRLAEIDTPERGQPWASRARQALAKKVSSRTVRVDVVDVDRYGRTVGKVWLGDRDINRELVREGHAWVYRKYMTDRSLLKDEAEAKASSRGLWGLPDPVPPWEWRRN